MTMTTKEDREDRRRAQRDGVAALEASGALDDLYARIAAGDVQPDFDRAGQQVMLFPIWKCI